LRNKIYEQVLKQEILEVNFYNEGRIFSPHAFHIHEGVSFVTPSICRTSYQLSLETTEMFFALSTFEVFISDLQLLGQKLPEKVRNVVRVLRLKGSLDFLSSDDTMLSHCRRFPQLSKIVGVISSFYYCHVQLRLKQAVAKVNNIDFEAEFINIPPERSVKSSN
jgi:hypothetical protein